LFGDIARVLSLGLRKEKDAQLNRFYLLGSILFSLLVPSFIITVAPTILDTTVFTEVNTFQQLPISHKSLSTLN